MNTVTGGVDQTGRASALVDSALGGRRVLHAIAGTKAVAQLEDEGICVLDDLWSDALGGALGEETEAVGATMSRQTRGGYRIVPDHDMLGPFSNGSASGPLLRALHCHPGLVSGLRTLTGRLLVPTSSAYLFYTPGDHTGLHADLSKCELVLLATLSGNLGPLMLHLDLAGAPPGEIVALGLETGGAPDGGTPMPVAAAGVTALRGREIPHHRPRCGSDERGVVATLCYRAAF